MGELLPGFGPFLDLNAKLPEHMLDRVAHDVVIAQQDCFTQRLRSRCEFTLLACGIRGAARQADCTAPVFVAQFPLHNPRDHLFHVRVKHRTDPREFECEIRQPCDEQGQRSRDSWVMCMHGKSKYES